MGRSDSVDFPPHGVQLLQSITDTYFGIVGTKQSGENKNTCKTVQKILFYCKTKLANYDKFDGDVDNNGLKNHD
jgi:hypothetical protein